MTGEQIARLAQTYLQIDPNLASVLFTLASVRIADETFKELKKENLLSFEEQFQLLCIGTTDSVLSALNYEQWLQTGGTEDETNS